jgi:hypothetical protein
MKQGQPQRVVGTVASLLLAAAAAQASPPGDLALPPGDTGEFGNGGSIAGWGWAFAGVDFHFRVTAPTQVTALAYYQLPDAMPLKRAILVTIDLVPDQGEPQMVASAVVGPGCEVDHVSTNVDFLYAPIDPVTLSPGARYQVTETFLPSDQPNSFFYATSVIAAQPAVTVELDDGVYRRFGANFFMREAVFGDLDGDGVVDGGDLGLLLLYFGPCEDGCGGADLDGDGQVDSGDLGLLLLSYT